MHELNFCGNYCQHSEMSCSLIILHYVKETDYVNTKLKERMITYDVIKWKWSWHVSENSPVVFRKKKRN